MQLLRWKKIFYLVRYHVSHGSLDEAWQNHIYSDPESSQLLGSSLGEPYHSSLARCVVSLANVASPGHDAGNVDNGSTQLLILHQTGSCLDSQN